MYINIYWLYGESETSIIPLRSSTYTVWQFIVFLVLPYTFPGDDRESDRNMLVINNMW